jgi:hypothetical protein
VGPCRSRRHAARGGGVHGHIVAGGRADAAGAGGGGQSQLGRKSGFLRKPGNHLAGEAFETLNENRWSRRDCTEYQGELDWGMRTFRRICNELDSSGLPAKMRRAARARKDRVNHEYQRATRVVERLLRAHEGRPEMGHPAARGGPRDERKCLDKFDAEYAPEGRMEYENSVLMDRTGGPPCRWPTSLERADRRGPGTERQELDACAPLRPTGAEESVTSAWRVCTSVHPHAFREAEGRPSQAAPAHRW